MELLEEPLEDKKIDRHYSLNSDNDCEQQRLLLKKNLSWTVSKGPIGHKSGIKTTRSTPQIHDIAPNVRSLASSSLKLATSQFILKSFQSQSISLDDASVNRTQASKAMSTATTHQTLATPTSIQLNTQPPFDFKFYCRAILRHSKVNSQLTRSAII
jgi:hypothetical protein